MDDEEQPVGIVFPDTLGACIDKLYALRAQRLEQEREIKERKRTETAYKDHIIAELRKATLDGGKGDKANASITTNDEPTPNDWTAIWQYIKENDADDLVQRRLYSAAVKARWEAGEEVAGIGHFTVVDLSLTKRGK